jgi:hypothetical protein
MSWSEFQTRRRAMSVPTASLSEEERKRRGLPSRFLHLHDRAPAPPPRPMAVVPPQLLDEDPASLYQTAGSFPAGMMVGPSRFAEVLYHVPSALGKA